MPARAREGQSRGFSLRRATLPRFCTVLGWWQTEVNSPECLKSFLCLFFSSFCLGTVTKGLDHLPCSESKVMILQLQRRKCSLLLLTLLMEQWTTRASCPVKSVYHPDTACRHYASHYSRYLYYTYMVKFRRLDSVRLYHPSSRMMISWAIILLT